jgi:hypothetical protein
MAPWKVFETGIILFLYDLERIVIKDTNRSGFRNVDEMPIVKNLLIDQPSESFSENCGQKIFT